MWFYSVQKQPEKSFLMLFISPSVFGLLGALLKMSKQRHQQATWCYSGFKVEHHMVQEGPD